MATKLKIKISNAISYIEICHFDGIFIQTYSGVMIDGKSSVATDSGYVYKQKE